MNKDLNSDLYPHFYLYFYFYFSVFTLPTLPPVMYCTPRRPYALIFFDELALTLKFCQDCNFLDDLQTRLPIVGNRSNLVLFHFKLLLGTISNIDKHSLPLLTHRSTSMSQEQHNVIPLAPNPVRFMLLPISSQQDKVSQMRIEVSILADPLYSDSQKIWTSTFSNISYAKILMSEVVCSLNIYCPQSLAS